MGSYFHMDHLNRKKGIVVWGRGRGERGSTEEGGGREIKLSGTELMPTHCERGQ